MELSRNEVIQKILPTLGLEVQFALLFGSSAKDQLKPESDIDLAVYLNSPIQSWEKRFEFKESIQKNLNRELDLIFLNDADPIITMQILNDGELILNRNPDHFLLYKAQKTSEYIDFKRDREIIEETLLKTGWPKWSKKTLS